jgi:hypothetical protein
MRRTLPLLGCIGLCRTGKKIVHEATGQITSTLLILG